MADALANASGTSLTGPSGHTDRRYLGAVADDCETDHDADLVLEAFWAAAVDATRKSARSSG